MTQWFAKYTGTLAGMVKTAVCLDTGGNCTVTGCRVCEEVGVPLFRTVNRRQF